jgi:hypothetical protein
MGKMRKTGKMGTMQPVIRVYTLFICCLSNKILNNSQKRYW